MYEAVTTIQLVLWQ